MTPNIDEPRTIEELRAWFKEHGYEPARTRFFVGVDIKSPKAFGIYKDEFGEFVVYKNKADGTRAIRYQGEDEAFAVHELYQRFQEEIINQQIRWEADHNKPLSSPIYSFESEKKPVSNMQILLFFVIGFCSFFFTLKFCLWLQNSKGYNIGPFIAFVPIFVMAFALLAYRAYLEGQTLRESIDSLPKGVVRGMGGLVCLLMLVGALAGANPNRSGYYSINNDLYYRAGDTWYYYNDHSGNWGRTHSVPSAFTSSDWEDYQNTSSHRGNYTSFESTSYYNSWRSTSSSYSSHSDSGTDHSWSSHNWDSGSTDWNSDW